MLIANTTDQKFLEAILAEQQKTNDFLSQLLEVLRPMRKDTEPKTISAKELFGPEKPVKKSPVKRGTNNQPKRGNKDAKIK